ncbi:MAG: formate dehydrogenase accessory sulfurtransferase FdhD [Candidatus Obscuribacterales bacterium]|nr:formate dehydrogenase accessory sulfurtransferase FdhD [Candidatus Obscuribacterales bacterium]
MAERSSKIQVQTSKIVGLDVSFGSDSISVEEPLEIRLAFGPRDGRISKQVAVTMRTPGDDRDLAAGFLFTEALISSWSELEEIESEKCNLVTVSLKENVAIEPSILERHSFVASSCGVCGKKSIDAVRVRRQYFSNDSELLIGPDIIHSLPETLRRFQSEFESTGGIHAASLFDKTGNLLKLKEDVGRHNALDKLIGNEFLSKNLPLSDKVLMLSGRASFELLQKAAQAGIPLVAAVGAPSSLAIELADEFGITLLGFVRDGRFNIYSGAHRIGGL